MPSQETFKQRVERLFETKQDKVTIYDLVCLTQTDSERTSFTFLRALARIQWQLDPRISPGGSENARAPTQQGVQQARRPGTLQPSASCKFVILTEHTVVTLDE